jgi:disulfide bond formation protein DsbB
MPSNRTLLLTIAAACVALVAAAVAMQQIKDLLPCPLCVIQRYLYLAVAACCLWAVYGRKPKAGTALALLASLGGLGVAGKHLYILANPGFSCGIDPTETFLNKLPSATFIPWVFRADGLCEDATAPFLGLSFPQWSGLCFALITAALVVAIVKLRRQP